MNIKTQEEHDMSVAIATEPEPARVAGAEPTTRPVVVRVNDSARRPQAREAAAGRLVWRTHDTSPVWLPSDAEPEVPALIEKGGGMAE